MDRGRQGAEQWQMLDELLAGVTRTLTSDDPLDGELSAAALVAAGEATDPNFAATLADELVPEFERRATPGGLAMLLALGVVAPGRAAREASMAARRLISTGVPTPSWLDVLDEPVTAEQCRSLAEPTGTMEMLLATFRRAGRGHTILTQVNYLSGGAVAEILLLPADRSPEILAQLRAGARRARFDLDEHALDPTEFRRRVERAIHARSSPDADLPWAEGADLLVNGTGDDASAYPVLLPLLQARLATLPAPTGPEAAR